MLPVWHKFKFKLVITFQCPLSANLKSIFFHLSWCFWKYFFKRKNHVLHSLTLYFQYNADIGQFLVVKLWIGEFCATPFSSSAGNNTCLSIVSTGNNTCLSIVSTEMAHVLIFIAFLISKLTTANYLHYTLFRFTCFACFKYLHIVPFVLYLQSLMSVFIPLLNLIDFYSDFWHLYFMSINKDITLSISPWNMFWFFHYTFCTTVDCNHLSWTHNIFSANMPFKF